MTTPEGAVKRRVKTLLNKYGVWSFAPVSNGMGVHGIPDFIGVINGVFLGVECKSGNKRPTPRQEGTMGDIQRAGGRCFLVNEESGMDSLTTWLEEVTA